MSPRYLSPAQARLAVEAAGLDPSRPVDEQLNDSGGIEQQVAGLAAKVDALTEALEGKSDEPQQTPERALADKLNAAQSQWFSAGGN